MKHRQKVLNLRPTQFAVGMLEVEEKIEIVRKYRHKQIRDFIDENPVPVVIGPGGDLYIVDGHHLVAVCYHIGVKKVRIHVIRDVSKRTMSYAQFWKWMFKTRNAYPYCQFGEGPQKALYLPRDIRGLADDPYRSLAWYVRKAGAFSCDLELLPTWHTACTITRRSPCLSRLTKCCCQGESTAHRTLSMLAFLMWKPKGNFYGTRIIVRPA
jgi:hypothetical protein